MQLTMRLCQCGRQIYGIGRRCVACQTAHRASRAEVLEKIARLPQIDGHRRPAHLAWVRLFPCAAAWGCKEKAEAAHVRLNTGGGMGLKPDDRWTIPLCRAHHAEQHQIGHAAFDGKYGIDSRALAERLAAESPYLKEMI